MDYEQAADTYEIDDSEPQGHGRFRSFLTRAEGVYLEILRAGALIVATGLLLWLLWLLASSLYNLARDPEAVTVADVEVSAADVADIQINTDDETSADETDGKQNPRELAFLSFRDQYFDLYQKSFEAFRHDDDKVLTKDQFVEKFLDGFDQGGELEYDDLSKVTMDLHSDLLKKMTEAAALPLTKERLEQYRKTPKVEVKDKKTGYRDETYCSYYSDYFGECLRYSSRTVPYTQTETRMEPPKGVLSHQDLFAAYQDNYLTTLQDRTDSAIGDAEAERSEREAANAKGWLGLSQAIWFAGAFMAIMFFFLLIAIERHQRRIAAQLR